MNDEDLYFVDGNVRSNYYDPVNDIIFIDENLDDYPLAKHYIVQHEIKHQENRLEILDDLIHEFKNDWFMEFSFSDEAVELRKYFDNELDELSWIYHLKSFIMKFSRSTWSLILVPSGSIYRKLYRRWHDID